MWKNKIKNLNWRNSYFSHCLLHHSDLLYKLLQYSIHYYKIYYNTNHYTCTSKCTIDITIPSQYCNYSKQTEDILQTVPDYKKSGNTTNCNIKQFTIYQHILKISSNNSNIKTTKLILTLMK